MKHLLHAACLLPLISNAQIQNGGFEELNVNGEPIHWVGDFFIQLITFDSLGNPIMDEIQFDDGWFFQVNTQDVHSGTNAIDLRNAFNVTQQQPIVMGYNASPDTTGSEGFATTQIPTTERPTSFAFHAKYLPADPGDSAYAEVRVINDFYEPIGEGTVRFGGTFTQYDLFTIPVTYTSTEPAAFVTVRFQTSTPGGQATFGTRLLIDDVSMSSEPQGIVEEKAAPAITLYPQPADQLVNIGRSGTGPLSVQLLDATGRAVRPTRMVSGPLDTADLPCGTYLLDVVGEEGRSRARLVVAR